MPKVIEPELKARAVRLVLEHRAEYPTMTAAVLAVSRQVGVGKESLRRWVTQASVDAGDRPGVTTEELEEIRRLKAENRRLREDVAVLKAATSSFVGELDPPQPLIMGFIDAMRGQGHAVESVCRVLREQGCQVAARTYRAWRAGRPCVRTLTDAAVQDLVRAAAWTTDHTGRRRLTPEGLYGRRKMTALVRRSLPDASPGSVDRAMRFLGLQGIRRGKAARTTIPGKGGHRAGDLLDRDFTADAPNRTWVMDFTYVRTWAGFGYVAFILDVFAQKIVAWNASTSKVVDLVDVPLRIALWQRDRDGHAVVPGELIGHADAGSQYTSIAFTDHLAQAGIRPSIGTVADAYDCETVTDPRAA